MALIDEVEIEATAGRGGDGVIRWLRTKSTARGGPSGGDGGKGGDVLVAGVRDLSALASYRSKKKFHAGNGESGKESLKHGADGDDLLLCVPVGTNVRVASTGEEYEIITEDEPVCVFRGGAGGKGNARFKSSTNQNPFQQTAGKGGEGGAIVLTLKIIADIGLVGLPNAGKSSLLNAVTNAKSRVGAYPFTTLEPNIGDFYGYTIADIPGLIEGASLGKGLGIKFLKHVERTGIILHLVSADREDPVSAYKAVRKEVESFGRKLLTKREIVVLSKIDLISSRECETKQQLLERETGREVLMVSVMDQESVKAFADRLTKILKTQE